MPISRAHILLATGFVAAIFAVTPVIAQDGERTESRPEALAATANPEVGAAADAAQAMGSAIDGAASGITTADQIAAYKAAAAAGDPNALWQLGMMYENGTGVPRNRATALGYFSEIANQYADAAPKSTDADIVAQAFVKMGDYFGGGIPEAGIAENQSLSEGYLKQAADWFGSSEAEYRMGVLYLDPDKLANPLMGARYLQSASKQGYVPAQARLGDLLFNGDGVVKAKRVDGLMWLTVASRRADGTVDASWISDLLNADMLIASPDERSQAVNRADSLETQFDGTAAAN